jgi:hypothetical protein
VQRMDQFRHHSAREFSAKSGWPDDLSEGTYSKTAGKTLQGPCGLNNIRLHSGLPEVARARLFIATRSCPTPS